MTAPTKDVTIKHSSDQSYMDKNGKKKIDLIVEEAENTDDIDSAM